MKNATKNLTQNKQQNFEKTKLKLKLNYSSHLKCSCDTWTANCSQVIHDLICDTFKLRFGNQFISMSPSENIMIIIVAVLIILFFIYIFAEVRAKLHKKFQKNKKLQHIVKTYVCFGNTFANGMPHTIHYVLYLSMLHKHMPPKNK